MAFSFANVAAGLDGTGSEGVQVHDGPDMIEIQTDQLAFVGINGEAKIKLLPEPWPIDALPIPSASLLSVASSQGLLAAGGPTGVVIVETSKVRNVLEEKSDEKIRYIEPLLTLSHPRVAHIAFSADESVLVVSEQEMGGIIAYQVDQLKSKQTEPALQLSTNKTGLRALVPNPSVQSAHFFACITTNGELLLADLSRGQWVEGPTGIALVNDATSVSWSNKGRQFVAGLANGSATQIKPDGSIAARIPRSTSILDGNHISAISWLENDSFLMIFTPNTTNTEEGIPQSDCYIVNRIESDYTFHKLPEVVSPFGMEQRVPTHHFITRLRDWKPHLKDLVLLSASTATEIGMLTKASHELSSSDPVTNVFTVTSTNDDTRRAALPLSGSATDTSPIGMALDLSAKESVVNPIPSDPEIEQTTGPVPNILILNDEGTLCSWWIIYSDSVRQKTAFSGFARLSAKDEARAAASPTNMSASLDHNVTSSASTQQSLPSFTEVQSSMSQQGLPHTSAFAKPTSTFGTSSPQSAFGSGNKFGSSSQIGEQKNSWTSTGFVGNSSQSGISTAFGKPGFTQPTFGSPAVSNSGNSASAFGTPGALGSRGPAFGQTGFSTHTSDSALGNSSNSTNAFSSMMASSGSSGFASFAKSGGFGSVQSDTRTDNKTTPFGNKTFSSFAQNSNNQNPFQKPSAGGAFGQNTSTTSFTKSSPFATGTSKEGGSAFSGTNSFKLGSSFVGDGTAKDDLPKPSADSSFGLGSAFGDMLENGKQDTLSPTHDKEEEMQDEQPHKNESQPESEQRSMFEQAHRSRDESKKFTTPPSTIAQGRAVPAQPVAGLFNVPEPKFQTPETSNFSSSWSNDLLPSTTPKETPAATKSAFPPNHDAITKPEEKYSPEANTSTTQATVDTNSVTSKNIAGLVTESPSDDDTVNIKRIPDAPLPPDPTTKFSNQNAGSDLSSHNLWKAEGATFPPAEKSSFPEPKDTAIPDDNNDNDDINSHTSDLPSSAEDGSPAEESDVEVDVSGDEDEENETEEQEEDEARDELQTSPESSFKGGNLTTSTTSPTGGLFTNISSNQQSRPSRPLFGEIGLSAPMFPPPKPQESPRSPSPVRNLLPHDVLRPDARSVSAPVHARSAIEQRKAEYAQSGNAAKAAQARQEEAMRERMRLEVQQKAQQQARVDELAILEDDEDERIQRELNQPIQPTENLDAFITFEPTARKEGLRIDIPAQIERLYQDINSMVYTLGINARSLACFIAYQKGHQQNESWPAVLESMTPLDALNDEWFLADIQNLHAGHGILEQVLQRTTVHNVAQMLESCQRLLTQDVMDLRNKATALRKSFQVQSHTDTKTIPLSMEQASVQQDLRKAAATVQTKLVAMEDNISVLRAKIADSLPSETARKQPGGPSKKPTVEAISNTVAKMTNMAEKKSADVDVLEGQLRRLGLIRNASVERPADPITPPQNKNGKPRTPASTNSSVFYTPESRHGSSARSTHVNDSAIKNQINISTVSQQDRSRWRAKGQRKKNMASILQGILSQKQAELVTT